MINVNFVNLSIFIFDFLINVHFFLKNLPILIKLILDIPKSYIGRQEYLTPISLGTLLSPRNKRYFFELLTKYHQLKDCRNNMMIISSCFSKTELLVDGFAKDELVILGLLQAEFLNECRLISPQVFHNTREPFGNNIYYYM